MHVVLFELRFRPPMTHNEMGIRGGDRTPSIPSLCLSRESPKCRSSPTSTLILGPEVSKNLMLPVETKDSNDSYYGDDPSYLSVDVSCPEECVGPDETVIRPGNVKREGRRHFEKGWELGPDRGRGEDPKVEF